MEQTDKDDEGGVDVTQIEERLRWTPAQRLRYLLDMLEFEELAHRARRVER